MKKIIKVIALIVIFAIITVAVAGFIKFNILQDDIYITQKDGNIVRHIDLEEYVFTTQSGITGIFAYISKDKDRATLSINGGFYQLKRVISASGEKYTNEDKSVTFWEHQGEARIELDDTTYLTSNLERSEILTFAVDSQKVDCVGVGPRKCLVINGEYFYSDIRGFEPEEGIEYEIIVARTERENVPADASKYLYRLVEIVKPAAQADNSLLYDKFTSASWVWKETQYSNGKLVKPIKADKFVATFSKDNKFSSTTDCNNVFGAYSIENNNISFGRLASTRKACFNETQEKEYTDMISKEVISFIIDKNGDLVFLLKDDIGSMIFTSQI